ncbi:MAG: hypothetical protein OES84_02205, partial [Kiritimatiellaceae bacterium]|nr:hypothetical protein [Kiritimatiellaceae bacterium]
EFNAANESFDAAGKSRRIGQLRELSRKFAKIKPVDKKRLSDQQLADLFNEASTANQMTLYYLYYHHMRRRPASANPEDYAPLAGAVLDKLNYTKYSGKNPFVLKHTEAGYSLDLSRAPYSVFSLNIIGVYRRQVLSPLKLSVLDISNTKVENLSEFDGLQLDELRISGVPIENRSKNYLMSHVTRFKLKRIVLDEDDYPPQAITELRKKIEVIDSKKSASKKNTESK